MNILSGSWRNGVFRFRRALWCDMQVSLQNDGPVTIILDTAEMIPEGRKRHMETIEFVGGKNNGKKTV